MPGRRDDARVDPRRALVPSVLDRLLDDDPEVKNEPASAGRPLLRDLRQAVRRDIEKLLNSRRRPLSCPKGEIERSVLDYGVPDLTGADLASPSAREEFMRLVEAVIRRAEPRFQQVRVVPLDEEEPLERTLRFRIEAQLMAEPAPEPVVFASELEPVTRVLEVEPGS